MRSFVAYAPQDDTVCVKIILTMLPFNLGIPEVAVILGVALLIFGPKKLPELGRNLGKGLKNFKESLNTAATEMKAGLTEEDSSDKNNKLINKT